MKKLILTIMMLASIQTYAGQDGGGGGVIKRDGMYLTFGSAKVKVGYLGMQQVPGLDLLISVLEANHRGIPAEFQGLLLNAVLPSNERRYFKIDQSQLNIATYTKLIAEYSKLLKNQIDPNALDLAAITIQNDTFLLPPFFQLKPAEQAAILFHESIWIIKPDIQYDELVSAEVTMQNHIEQFGTNSVYDLELLLVIGQIFNSPSVVFAAALNEDIKAGLFKVEVPQPITPEPPKKKKKSKAPVETPVPQYNYITWEQLLPNSHTLFTDRINTGVGALVSDLNDAMKKYPQFTFLKALYKVRNSVVSLNLYSVPDQARVFEDTDYRSRNLSCVGVTEAYHVKICFKVGGKNE
jgi:hypothetical protein